jgi:hypothetical protein
MKTKNEILKDWKDSIYDIIDELKTWEFENSSDTDLLVTQRDEFEERINEMLWQEIDGCQDVIYTHNAKEISAIINIYDVFEEWDLTGERFENWSQCAFANIYDMIQNEIDINEIITQYFADKYLK